MLYLIQTRSNLSRNWYGVLKTKKFDVCQFRVSRLRTTQGEYEMSYLYYV